MLKMHLAASLAATALMAGAAYAQTSPTQGAGGAGQFMTEMQPNTMRGSKLMGVDVYGSDNQKIGDIDEVIVDREGKIQAVVIGVGGFLGIGQKDVAVPYSQLQWMNDDQARSAANTPAGGATGGTNTAGGVTAPASPTQPTTTGSTGTAGAGAAAQDDDGVPDRAMIRMSKADLQNAPEFRYRDASRTAAGAGNPNPPPASANRPGNAPAPQQ